MKIFEPFNLKGLSLTSKIAMAPLTRRRCTREHVPVAIMQDYYAQRASAGLIIAEGTSPSPNGVGYANMPGLYNQEQVVEWKKVTDRVHRAAGKIFLQIMHTGRVGHLNNLPIGAQVIGPSAIGQNGEVATYDLGKQLYSVPKELTLQEVEDTIQEYVTCAILAMESGFDGIEIHGAHGYLPNQFLNLSSNQRKDSYGGSRENRMRFLLEVVKCCCDAIGSSKVALRISPFSYADVNEDESELTALYTDLMAPLNALNLSYLHLSHMGEPLPVKFNLWGKIRDLYSGNLMLCGDFSKESAEDALQNKNADLIAFGRDFISNPDLVERLKNNWPLQERDRTYWYTIGEKGLTDYSTYE